MLQVNLQHCWVIMKQNWKDYPDTRSVADYIMKAAENKKFPLSELESTLKLAAADLNVHFLAQGLLFVSSENLKQTLLDLNMEKQQVRNSQELISYLLGTSRCKELLKAGSSRKY